MKHMRLSFPLGLLVLALLVLVSPALPALPKGLSLGQLVMDHWNDRSGLPSNSVLDVLQDKQGYIWLASYDGLIRFDGRSFNVFTKESRNGFNSNSARVLEVDKDGTLWVGTNTDGLFSWRNGIFKSYGKEEGLPDLSVRALGFDIFGKLWVGTASGIAVANGESFKFFAAGEGISTFLLPLSDGSMLTGSNKPGLWKTGASGLEPWPGPEAAGSPEAELIGSTPFSSAYIDQKNQLWLGTVSGKLLVIKGNELIETIEPENLKGGTVKKFLADRDGTLWVATDKGLFYGDQNGLETYNETNGLPNNSVTSLYQDREGSLWTGTERGGIVKFSPGKFVNITQREGLKGNAVNTVLEDSFGSLWVGSDQGLSYLPSSTDPYVDEKSPRRKAVDQVLSDIGNARIRQIRSEGSGELAFSTYSDFGLYLFDGSASTSITQKEGLPVNRVRLSLKDKAGRLWVGTTAGLWMNEGPVVYGKKNGLPIDFVLDIHEDAAGTIWIGLDGAGLARRESDGTFKVWTTADGLAGNVVFRIFSDSRGTLWICTSDGLSIMQDDGTFKNIHSTDGLISDSIYQILADPGNGKFWLITSRGLAVLDPELLKSHQAGTLLDKSAIRVLNRLDGLAGQPAANSWAHVNKLGVIFFPTVGGLSVYNPQSINLNPTPPPVYLESVLLDGVAARSETPGAPITVSPGTQRITFQFAALSFMIPQKVGFQYRLEGYDKTFLPSLGERSAVYTNLPPGSYRFHVQAWNNDGVINEAGATVDLQVDPYFYQTPVFYILISVFLFALGFIINFTRTRVIVKRKAELERLVTVRTDALNLEKQRSDALLLNVLPPDVAEELKVKGSAEPKVHAGVSVMVIDLVGFTEKSARLSPAKTINELNTIFGAFDEIMDRHGCERVKTVGDAYLAAAGLSIKTYPEQEKTGALKIAAACLEILGWLKNHQRHSTLGWEVRVGIHTGPVVGGVVGIQKYIFDIFGDTVNTAFRMQTESVPGRATLSAKTASLLREGFDLENRGELSVKGKGSMELWFLGTKK